MNAITLPYPPSTNRLTRFGGGRAYHSPKAKAWKIAAALSARSAGVTASSMPMHVSITLHPRKNKDGSASKVRLDVDNPIKATFDALNGIAWFDDKQIIKVTAQIGHAVQNGALTVAWIEV